MNLRRTLAVFGLWLALVAQPVGAQGITGWQSLDTGQVDATYIGSIDSPQDGATVPASGLVQLSGWFVDTTARGWAGADAAQVVHGDSVVAQGTVGGNRPDVAATFGNAFWSASGFGATFDAARLPTGLTTLSIQLHTPARGWLTRTINLTVGSAEILAPAPAAQGPLPQVTVLTPQPGEAVPTSNRRYVISGSARDPSQPRGGIDSVEVWLNGEANTDSATLLGMPDVSGDGNWSFEFDPAQFEPADANLYVYARSAISGKRRLVVVHFQITNRP